MRISLFTLIFIVVQSFLCLSKSENANRTVMMCGQKYSIFEDENHHLKMCFYLKRKDVCFTSIKSTLDETFDKKQEISYIYNKALSCIEKKYGKVSREYIECLRIAAATYRRSDYDIHDVLNMELEAEKLLHGLHDKYTMGIKNEKIDNYLSLSSLYRMLDNKTKSIEYAEKAFDMYNEPSLLYAWEMEYMPGGKVYSPYHSYDINEALYELSNLYIDTHNYKKALESGARLLASYSNSEEIKPIHAMHLLNRCYKEIGDEKRKEMSFLENYYTDSQSDDKIKVYSLLNLAIHYEEIGDTAKMEASYDNALALAENSEGKESLLYAETLFFSSYRTNNYGSKISIMQEATEIAGRISGYCSFDYLRLLSILNNEQNQFKSKEDIDNDYKVYLNHLKTESGDNSRKYLESYTSYLFKKNIANLEAEAPDFSLIKKDIVEFENAILKVEKYLGDSDVLYLDAKSNLAYIYICMHQINTDTIIYRKAIQIQSDVVNKSKDLFGEYDISYIESIERLAYFKSYEDTKFQLFNNYGEIDSLQQIAVDFYKKKYGVQHKYYAQSIQMLVSYYNQEMNFYNFLYHESIDLWDEFTPKSQKIIELCDQALQIYESNGDTENSSIILDYLSKVYVLNKDEENGAICSKKRFDNWKKYQLSQFVLYTSEEKVRLVNSRAWKKQIDDFAKGVYKENASPIYKQVAYDAQLFNKGLLLNSETGLRDLINESNDSKSIAQYDRLLEIKRELANVTSDSVEANLRKEYNSVERALMKESQQYGDYMKNLSVTFSDVKSNMTNHDVCIEFAYSMGKYYALVLKKSFSSPKPIEICSEADLSKSDNSYNVVWTPLMDELKGMNNVYFAPAMTLNKYPIESASLTNRELSKLNIYRVSSTREIIKKHSRHQNKTAVLYGGLKYNTDVDVLISSDKQERAKGLRGAMSLDGNIKNDLKDRGVNWEYLPGTLNEVFEIAKITSSYGIKTKQYTDTVGTESTFKNLSHKGVNILHVATHGNYIESKEGISEEEQLERSYLVMTGADNAKNGIKLPDGVDDGILTASEISRLDFRGLDLVVLSACETGLGNVSSEGVYGLQRGFKKAGANSLIMSLWDVDDDATKMLMIEFYKNYLNGVSKRESLKKAQEYLRQNGFDAPEFWAGFILLDGLD